MTDLARETVADLQELTKAIEEEIERAADALGNRIAAYAREPEGPTVRRWRRVGGKRRLVSIRATRGRWAPDTGQLQQAIDHRVERRRGSLTLWIRAMTEYAFYLENKRGFSVLAHAVKAFEKRIQDAITRAVDRAIKRVARR